MRRRASERERARAFLQHTAAKLEEKPTTEERKNIVATYTAIFQREKAHKVNNRR